MTLLILFGGFQALFLACLQMANIRLLKSSAYWLAAVSFCLAVALFDGYLYLSEQYRYHTYLIGLSLPFVLLFEPLIYGYIYHITGQRVSRKFILHFVPALLVVLLFSPVFLLSEQEKVQLLFDVFPETAFGADFIFLGFVVLSLGVLLQTPVYIWLIVKRTRLYRSALKAMFSTEAKTSILWLRFIITNLAIAWVLTIVQQLTITQPLLAEISFYALHIFLVFVAFALCYLGFQKQKLFAEFNHHAMELLPAKLGNQDEKGKYVNSSLDEATSKLLFEELLTSISANRYYLQHNLTLIELAEYLSVSTNHLSQCINQNASKSFFDFINGYRIDEAKSQLIENKDKSITNIAEDSGFNSKTAFYNAFKRLTGQTPTAYRASAVQNMHTSGTEKADL